MITTNMNVKNIMIDTAEKKKTILRWLICLFTAVCLVSFTLYEVSFRAIPVEAELGDGGIVDISGMEPSTQLLTLPRDLPFYPGKLYEPADFAGGSIEPGALRSEVENAWTYTCGTYRVVIKAEPKVSYMMYGYSIDYGMKLYANGMELIEIGTIADSAGEAVPRIDDFIVPLTADDNGNIELVIQYSNFAHKSGGSIPEWRISGASTIIENRQQWMFATALFGGCFVTLALYMAYSAIINKSLLYLIISLMCCGYIFRNQNFYYGFILKNNYNWYLCYRLNLMATMSEPFFLYYVFRRLIPESRFKTLRFALPVINVVFDLALLVFDTKLSSLICNIGAAIGIVFVGLLFFKYAFVLYKKKVDLGDAALAASAVLIAICGLSETFLYHKYAFITRSGIMSFATLFFIFVIKAIVDYKKRKVEKEYEEQKHLSDALETQRKIRQDFLANISHEMRTPLTVMSGYAQRVQLKLRKSPDIVDYEEIQTNLGTISSEARRLAALVNQLLETSVRKETAVESTEVDLEDMRRDFKNLCSPILEKNNNKLDILFPAELPHIHGNRSLINQILVNITVNANRHCKGDTLVLRAEYTDNSDFVLLCLEDHGDGMSKEKLENALVSGYSGDGGTGLGLAICSETMAIMGGTLGLESELNVGTTVKLFFKVWRNGR